MSPLRIWADESWQSVTPRVWDGEGWVIVSPRVWDGERWLMLSGGATIAPANPMPPTDDPVIEQMRPRRHVAQIRVKPGDNLAAACESAMATRELAGHDTRVLVLIEPGQYTATLPHLYWISLASTTGDPADVTVTGTTTSPQRGVIEAGEGVYMEGITLVKPSGGHASLVYPIHAAQSGTRIYARVVLRAPDGFVYGADGGGGGTTVFYRSRLEVATVTSPVTNIHGASTTTAAPLTAVFASTSTPGQVWLSQHNPGGVGTGDTWAVDLTAGSVRVDHHLHLSGGNVPTVTAPSRDDRADWPVPTDGLGDYDRRILYGG